MLKGIISRFRKQESPMDLEQTLLALADSPEELKAVIEEITLEQMEELIVKSWSKFGLELRRVLVARIDQAGFRSLWEQNSFHKDSSVRLGAIEVLSTIQSKESVPILLKLLGHQTETTQMAAVGALKIMIDLEIIEALVKALDKPMEHLPARVAEVLVAGDKLAKASLVEAYPLSTLAKKRLIIEILAQVGGEDILPILLKALEEPHDLLRMEAARALGELGLSDSVAPLMKALADPTPTVRARAAKALGKMKAEVAATALQEAALDKDWLVRGNAQEALAALKEETHVQ